MIEAAVTAAVSFESLGYKPLELESNQRASRWLVPVSINGKTCKLTLDTGADAANSIPKQAMLTDVSIGETRLAQLTAHMLSLEGVF